MSKQYPEALSDGVLAIINWIMVLDRRHDLHSRDRDLVGTVPED